jgi:hypothetical protein
VFGELIVFFTRKSYHEFWRKIWRAFYCEYNSVSATAGKLVSFWKRIILLCHGSGTYYALFQIANKTAGAI